MWIITRNMLEQTDISIPSSDWDELLAVNCEEYAFQILDKEQEAIYQGSFYGSPEQSDVLAPLEEYVEEDNNCSWISYFIGENWELIE